VRFKAPVVVGFTGAYQIDGNRYPWVDLQADGGDDPLRASIDQAYTAGSELTVGTSVVADLELRKDRNGKLKLRIHGAEVASGRKAA
jgi:hypothetical protein